MNLQTVAKVIAKTNPSAFSQAKQLCEPMLKVTKFIPQIHNRIKQEFPDIDKTDESILFAACVYSAYAPATLLGQRIERAPNGIRKVMCEIMQWNDEPVVNYYQDIARSYLKGPKFKEKVSSILMGFEQFSVKPNQIELF